MRIEDITFREVLTPKLQRTIEIEIKTRKGIAHSPIPVNKNGIYRIYSLPVEDAIKKFLEIKRHFINQTFDDVHEIDTFLHTIDISVDFREIGGNLAFAISSAFLKAYVKWEGVKVYEYLSKSKAELPVPLCIMADKEKTKTDFKEFLLYPVQQRIFSKSIVKLVGAYNALKLHFGQDSLTYDKILKTLSGITTKNSLQIGVNLGATDIWNDRKYAYNTGENLNSQEQLILIQDIAKNYPVGYVEDPFHEDDFVMSATLTHRLPTRLVVGNELYSNNFGRFKRGIELKATSGMTITPTQLGTISDVINLVKEAKRHKIATIISDKIDDSLISNLAAGLKFDYIKLGMGSLSANRINELIRIEN
ncbi:MAG: hypothetical protein HYS80_00510, partial [Candidatus Aenigmarchaeota archaeon]|nr:hypothetical protein [Candidatus Aenigmarchaeota archaeon]